MSSNCIDAACEAAVAQPGYIALRTPSLRWRPYPHAMWASMLAGDIINWHPQEPAGKVSVVFGYEGVADTQDHAAPRVWTPNKLMLAAVVFAAGVVLWRCKRLWRRHG